MTSSPPEQTPANENREPATQNYLLIGILGGLFIIVLAAIIYLILQQRPAAVVEPTPQPEIIPPTEVLLTETPASTSTATQRATFTPKATRTSTITPTPTLTPLPTLLPSLTPAFPSEHNDQYKLVHWTPDLANEMIALMEVYPDTLSSFARGADDQGYYDAFQYALFSQREALHQFPAASQAADWQWQYAYNLARTGDESAGEVFAGIITKELSSGQLNLDDLSRWSLDRTPPVEVEVISLDATQGDRQEYLVKVSIEENGGSYFWLIEEASGIKFYSLTSKFNFVHPSEMDNFIDYLVGTNNAIVGLFPLTVHDSLQYYPPEIFSLSQEPPVELPFEQYSPPAIGPDFVNHWQPIGDSEQEGQIQFLDAIFAACPVVVNHSYFWNGRAFAFLNDTYQINPDQDLLSYCEIVINHALITWGLEPTIQLMEELLPIWPPEITTTGDPFPEDALDEWQYRLSIYHALLANQTQSIEYANNIVTNPVTPESSWIIPAGVFLEAYQVQRDIYRACFPSIHCNPRLAFQSLTKTISPHESRNVITIMEDAGVTVRSNGFFDFDNDGETERWVVLRHQQGTPLEFWILFPGVDSMQAVFLDTLETDSPRLSYVEPLAEPPVVELNSATTFTVVKQGVNQEPVIVMVEQEVIFASDRTELELDQLEFTLFSGGDPAFVQTELLILRDSPHFTCSYILCPRYLYLLGLASELANDERAAVGAYLELWRNFIDSPYATMARFKLLSTITPIPTLTPTNTVSPTPEPEDTSTPTLEPTFTPTIPGYPYPYPAP